MAATGNYVGTVEARRNPSTARLDDEHVDETTIRPASQRWPAVAGLVVALLAVVLVVSSRDDTSPGSSSAIDPSSGPDAPAAGPFLDDGWDVRVVSNGPLLGEETGQWLLVNNGTLRAFDLDAGVEYDLGLEATGVWWADGNWVVISANGMVALDLRTMEQTPLAFFGQPTADPAPPGQAWLRSWPATGVVNRLVRFDLATGRELQSVDLPMGDWRDARAPVAPQLVGSPDSGGVYRIGSDGPEQVFDSGYVMATYGDHILVDRCDDELRCALAWLDPTGQVADDLSVPPPGSGEVRGAGNERWLTLESWDGDREVRLFDVETGRTVDVDAPDPLGSVTVSPDGRWAAERQEQRLLIHDLDNPDRPPVDLGLARSEAAVWLDAPVAADPPEGG